MIQYKLKLQKNATSNIGGVRGLFFGFKNSAFLSNFKTHTISQRLTQMHYTIMIVITVTT